MTDRSRQIVSRRQLFGIGPASPPASALPPAVPAAAARRGKRFRESGGTLTMGIASPPDTLDPGATGLALTLLMSMAMFDPLVWWLPPGRRSNSSQPRGELHGLAGRVGLHVQAPQGRHLPMAQVRRVGGQATYDHIVDPATKSKSGLGALGPYRRRRSSTHIRSRSSSRAERRFMHQQRGKLRHRVADRAGQVRPDGVGNNPVGTGPFSS